MERGYVRETLHYDRPMTPLGASVLPRVIERAFNRAAATHASGARIATKSVDGYVYTHAARVEERESGAEAPELGAIVDGWEKERVPGIEAALGTLGGLVAPHASARRAAGELARVPGILEDLLTLHYDTATVSQAGLRMLQDLLRGLGDERPEMTVALLMAPTESRLRDTDRWLAQMATLAARDRAALESSEAFHEGRERLATRASGVDLADPTWGEDDAPLRRALDAGADALPRFEEGTRRALARRAEAEARVRARLPPEARGQLAAVLDMTRRARGLAQTVNHLVGEHALGQARLAYLRAADRLVAEGVIAEREDVFFLAHDEVVDALTLGRAPAVAERRRAHALARAASPPERIGPVDGAMLDDPVIAALLGVGASQPGAALAGAGGSPGVAEGPARVVRHEADLARVEPGDVLVVVNLAPSWTPVMSRVAAIVTETGGMLSHAAIVAREMGVPAAVGVAKAMARLKDDDLVRVDGDAGSVKLVHEQE